MGAAVDIDRITPDELALRQLKHQTSLVLAAPCVGLREELGRWQRTTDAVRLTESLPATIDDESDDLPVVEEFDRVYRQASPQRQVAFHNELEAAAELCVVTRPRALDWMTTSENTALTAADLRIFDRILLVGYRTEVEQHREQALDRGMRVANDTDETESTVTRRQLAGQLDSLTYEHGFETSVLETAAETYGKTYTPAVVEYIGTSELEQGLLPRSVDAGLPDRDAVATIPRDLLKSCLEGKLTAALKDGVTSIIKSGAGSTAALASGLAGPAGVAGLLLLWVLVRGDNDGVSGEQVLETLAGVGTTPPARARLEQRLDLPPRTLDDLHWLVREGNITGLQATHQARADASIDFEQVEKELAAYDDELRTLTTRLEQVRDELETFTGLYSEQLARATADLTELSKTLTATETTLLQPLVTADTVDPVSLPFVPPRTVVHDGRNVTAEPTTTTLEELRGLVEQASVVILSGPSGVGKTTVGYRLGRILEAEGYTIRIPNLSEQSAGFVRQALRQSTGTDRLVLFGAYELGSGTTRISDHHVGTLLDWVEEGLCDCLVLECRAELYPQLRARLAKATAVRPQVDTLRVDIAPFDAPETVEDIVQWLATSADVTAPAPEHIERLFAHVDGNPALLKLALRFEFSKRHSTDRIASGHEFVMADIRTLLESPPGPREWYQQLIVLLAMTDGLTTAELCDLLDVEVSTLRERADPLRDYLSEGATEALETSADRGRSSDDMIEWRLSPSIYINAIVRECLTAGGPPGIDWVYDRLYVDRRSRSYDRRLLDVIGQLATAYETTQDSDEERIHDRTKNAINKLLAWSLTADGEPNTTYTLNAYIKLVTREVALDPTLLRKQLDGIVDAAGEIDLSEGDTVPAFADPTFGDTNGDEVVRADPFEASREPTDLWVVFGEGVIPVLLGYLLYNHLVRGRAPSDVAELISEAARSIEQHPGFEQGVTGMVANTYGFAFEALAKRCVVESDRLSEWIDEIDRHIRTTASGEDVNGSESTVRCRVYNTALKKVVAGVSPEKGEQLFDRLETQLIAAAQSDQTETDKRLWEAYRGTFQKLLDLYDYDNPTLQAWVRVIGDAVRTTATDDEPTWDSKVLLVNLYRDLFTILCRQSTPQSDATRGLYRCLEDQLWQASTVDEDAFSPAVILARVYGQVIVSVMEEAAPDDDRAILWVGFIRERVAVAKTDAPHRTAPDQFSKMVDVVVSKRIRTRVTPKQAQQWLDMYKQYNPGS